jgi:hypothetical protein
MPNHFSSIRSRRIASPDAETPIARDNGGIHVNPVINGFRVPRDSRVGVCRIVTPLRPTEGLSFCQCRFIAPAPAQTTDKPKCTSSSQSLGLTSCNAILSLGVGLHAVRNARRPGETNGQAKPAKSRVRHLRHRRHAYDPEGGEHVLADCHSHDASERWLPFAGGPQEDTPQPGAKPEAARAQ